MNIKSPKRLSVSSVILLSIIAVSVVMAVMNAFVTIQEGKSYALKSSEMSFMEISEGTISGIRSTLDPIFQMTGIASTTLKQPEDYGENEFYKNFDILKEIVEANENLVSSYIGFENGCFYQVITSRGNRPVMEFYAAPPETKMIDRILLPEGTEGFREIRRYFDANFNVVQTRRESGVPYDPRSRPWYVEAMSTRKSIFTAPYVFKSSRLPGITCARTLRDGSGVFGADVSLSRLGDMLAGQKTTEHGSIWILDAARRLVAFPGLSWSRAAGNDPKLPPATAAPSALVRRVERKFREDPGIPPGRPFFLELKGAPHIASLTPTSLHGLELVVAVAAPLDDITGHIRRVTEQSLQFSAIVLALILLPAIFMARRLSGAFGSLMRETGKIRRFDFSESPPVRSGVEEIAALAEAFETMKAAIRESTAHLIESQNNLQKLVEGGLALSEEKDIAKLVTLIFEIARELANADGGVLYLLEGEVLGVELLSLNSENLLLGSLSRNPAPRVIVRPEIMAFLERDSVLRRACEAFNRKETVVVRDVDLSLFPTGLPEEPRDYRINALIAVPIVTRQAKVIGVIQLFNPRDAKTGEFIGAENKEVLDFIVSLAAQAAVSLDNRNLMQSLRDLFDSLIRMIAASIDAKSPYTAGHCTRVPVLVEMLAEALHEAEDGPFRDFRLDDEEEWRELRIAAWMHDCGKVTTPEYVVDKGTKLETIHNRIHEIRTRFEVLRRDAEIDYYRKAAEGTEEPEALKKDLEDELRRLDEDFAFIAECNIGGEFMSQARMERLKRIAGRTWMRHYNDRAGLSQDELKRKGEDFKPELPVREFLLADKPEHIVARSRTPRRTNTKEHCSGIPEHEFHRGELYNLCISRGTLTAEERWKINEHVVMGLQMLEKIPFPETLRRIPEIASAHHETLTGSGYPFGKTKEQISIQARILAVADIFEALTAADRPYAGAKPLSLALDIMSRMSREGHIDPDIFEIFLKKDIFRRYSEQYLLVSQQDVRDIFRYLGKPS